jgi:hypothetical protein
MPNQTLSGGAFTDCEGNVLANGFLTFELSHDEVETSTTPNGQVVAGLKKKVFLDNSGNVVTNTGIWSNDVMNPAGSFYIVKAYTNSGVLAWKYPQYWTIPSAPNPYNLSAAAPLNPPTSGLGGTPVDFILLQTNGTNNSDQTLLDLTAGANVTLTNVAGVTTITAAGGGGTGNDTFLAATFSQTLSFPVSGGLFVDATAGVGGITLTLPTAVGLSGLKAAIIQIDTGAGGVTIATTSSQTINGASNYELTNQWQTITVESNNANWRIVAAAG